MARYMATGEMMGWASYDSLSFAQCKEAELPDTPRSTDVFAVNGFVIECAGKETPSIAYPTMI